MGENLGELGWIPNHFDQLTPRACGSWVDCMCMQRHNYIGSKWHGILNLSPSRSKWTNFLLPWIQTMKKKILGTLWINGFSRWRSMLELQVLPFSTIQSEPTLSTALLQSEKQRTYAWWSIENDMWVISMILCLRKPILWLQILVLGRVRVYSYWVSQTKGQGTRIGRRQVILECWAEAFR